MSSSSESSRFYSKLSDVQLAEFCAKWKKVLKKYGDGSIRATS